MGIQKCDICGGKVSDSAMECPHCGTLVRATTKKNAGGVGCLVFSLLAAVLFVGLAGYGAYSLFGGVAVPKWGSHWEDERRLFIKQVEAAAVAEDYDEVIRLCDSRNTHGDPLIAILRNHAERELKEKAQLLETQGSGSAE